MDTTKGPVIPSRVVLGLLLLLTGLSCHAHSPHDVIDVIEVADTAHGDILFTVVSHKLLLRSMDGGAHWKELVAGLDNRYGYTDIAVTPDFPRTQTIFLATDGDGIYVSHDGGWSWSSSNRGLPKRRISLLSTVSGHPRSLLAAGADGGVFRSGDGGRNWQTTQNIDTVVTAIASGMHGLWAGDDKGGIYRSEDVGQRWRLVSRLPRGDAGAVTSLAPLSDGGLLVGTASGGIFLSTDGGAHFNPSSQGITDRRIRSILVSPVPGQVRSVWASSWGEAVFRSTDSGRTWRRIGAGLTTDPQAETPLHHAPQFRDLRWASSGSGKRVLYLGGFDGLFRSVDLGEHWGQIPTLSEARIIALAVSPQQDEYSLALTTYGGGAYTATKPDMGWEIRNYGLKNPRLTDIEYSPGSQTDHTLITAARGELLKTDGPTARWLSVPLQPAWPIRFKRKVLGFLRRLGAPPSVTTDLLTYQERSIPFPTKIAVSPMYDADRTVFIATRRHGVIRWVEGSGSYDSLLELNDLVSSLAISPDYRHDRTIFASARQHGVFKSMDGGESWMKVNNGLEFLGIWNDHSADHKRSLVELGRSPYYDIHLAVSPAYAEDQTVYAGSGEGLYRSTDGGQNWRKLELGTGVKAQILALNLSPGYAGDGTLLVSVKGKGLFTSMDGGASFLPFAESLIRDNQQILHIVFSPGYHNDHTLFVASGQRVYRSQDGGDTWEHLNRPLRIEDLREVVHYSGDWKAYGNDAYSTGTARITNAPGASARMDFVGTGIRWIGSQAPGMGVASVMVDGEKVASIDQSATETDPSVISFETSGLKMGPHSIEIQVQVPRKGIALDALDVLGGN